MKAMFKSLISHEYRCVEVELGQLHPKYLRVLLSLWKRQQVVQSSALPELVWWDRARTRQRWRIAKLASMARIGARADGRKRASRVGAVRPTATCATNATPVATRSASASATFTSTRRPTTRRIRRPVRRRRPPCTWCATTDTDRRGDTRTDCCAPKRRSWSSVGPATCASTVGARRDPARTATTPSAASVRPERSAPC